mgnify:CR=1 FL=1
MENSRRESAGKELTLRQQRKLDHMIVFVDKNGWQSGGSVEETIGSNNIAERFAAFQWHTQEIDGHDIDAIRKAIDNARAEKDGQALSYATA